tara:strand:- start:23 stop:352 length:330 start_codon:yes stop_codon:yes gene_type:complete
MAAPNLLNATSIYGKNAAVSGNGSNQTVITCATDKLIKVTSINVHSSASNTETNVFAAGIQIAGGGSTSPDTWHSYNLTGFYLTESQTVTFDGESGTTCLVSYEEIDDA